ncbi:MAG: adenylosuccinate synthetase [Nitrososphaerota archaeon]|nr:adenylosuccinate synthetase [Nitrososphaerota archaeon]
MALKERPKIAVRVGSVNAGHTVVYKGNTYKLRMVPSAFLIPETRLLIGAGANVDSRVFLNEVAMLGVEGRVFIDGNASVIEQRHIDADIGNDFFREFIGTTGTGVSPALIDRVARKAKLVRDIPELSKYITDVSEEVNSALDRGEIVHIEGTQGFYLSLYHGTYPYVTGRDTTAAAVCSEVGVGPKRVDEVILVLKSFITRVGKGPLENEFSPEEAEKRGFVERGTVTGRLRRVAPFNFQMAKRACRVNGATQIAVTKVDVIFPECYKARSREALSERCLEFLKKIQDETGVPVTIVGTGPDAEDTLYLGSEGV